MHANSALLVLPCFPPRAPVYFPTADGSLSPPVVVTQVQRGPGEDQGSLGCPTPVPGVPIPVPTLFFPRATFRMENEARTSPLPHPTAPSRLSLCYFLFFPARSCPPGVPHGVAPPSQDLSFPLSPSEGGDLPIPAHGEGAQLSEQPGLEHSSSRMRPRESRIRPPASPAARLRNEPVLCAPSGNGNSSPPG